MPPVIKTASPFSCLFLFFLFLFIITGIIIFSPILLVLLVVILFLVVFFYVLFVREKLRRIKEKFRDSGFAQQYSRTREARREDEDEDEETDPDVVDVGFTVLNEDDPEKTGRSR